MVTLGLIFDLVITGLLAATIFYAVRLSRDLDTFRTTRNDLSQAMQEIAGHVTKAQSAVEELRLHAGQSAINLQSLITQADEVARELTAVSEAGNALANRLEGAASGASQRAQAVVQDIRPDIYAASPQIPERPYKARGSMTDGPAFTIQDREYDETTSDGAAVSEWGDDTESDGFFSKAERDLAAVLQKRRQR